MTRRGAAANRGPSILPNTSEMAGCERPAARIQPFRSHSPSRWGVVLPAGFEPATPALGVGSNARGAGSRTVPCAWLLMVV